MEGAIVSIGPLCGLLMSGWLGIYGAILAFKLVPNSCPMTATYIAWAFLPLAYNTWLGLCAWPSVDVTVDLHEKLPVADHLCRVMCAFQLCNVVTCCLAPKYRRPENIVHHLMTAALCYLSITTPFALVYTVFFVGVAELTSIPSTVVDAHRYLDDVRSAAPAHVVLTARALFALTFIGIRVIYWPYVSALFWIQCLQTLRDGSARSVPVLTFFLVCNVILTSMQLYWGRKILLIVRREYVARSHHAHRL